MIAWLALFGAVLAIVPWIALAVMVPRWWRRIEPQVRPLMQMFGPPPIYSSSDPAVERERRERAGLPDE